MENIIELQQVDKIYRGAVDTQVLFAIDLAFEAGSIKSKCSLLSVISQ